MKLAVNFCSISYLAFTSPEERIVNFIGKQNVEVDTNIYDLLNIFYKLGFSSIACFWRGFSMNFCYYKENFWIIFTIFDNFTAFSCSRILIICN